MFTVSAISFVIATINAAACISGFSTLIQGALVDNIYLPIDVNRSLTNTRIVILDIIIEWTGQLIVRSLHHSLLWLLDSCLFHF